MTDLEKKKAAYLALKFIYPDLRVNENMITPQAASFAFKVIVRVDKGTRISAGLFRLNTLYTSWTKLPNAFVKGLWEILKKPDEKLKNAVSTAFIAKPHRRMLQQHLDQPDVFPCPDLKNFKNF